MPHKDPAQNREEEHRGTGLVPLPEDGRDFVLGQVFELPALDELPEQFVFDPAFPIKDQGQTDFCTAYATCGASELQELVELNPEYSFAASKEISGDVDKWGQDLRSAMKAHVKRGATEQKIAAPSVEKLTAEQKRQFSYFEQFIQHALLHRKRTYFRVEGQYDAYDNIRAAIWKFREEKKAVILGMIWSYPSDESKITEPSMDGFGHAVYCVGWSNEGLIIVNSYGKDAGHFGKFVIAREVINANVPRFGAFMFTDIEKDEALYHIESGVKWEWNWIKKLVISVWNFLHGLARQWR